MSFNHSGYYVKNTSGLRVSISCNKTFPFKINKCISSSTFTMQTNESNLKYKKSDARIQKKKNLFQN